MAAMKKKSISSNELLAPAFLPITNNTNSPIINVKGSTIAGMHAVINHGISFPSALLEKTDVPAGFRP